MFNQNILSDSYEYSNYKEFNLPNLHSVLNLSIYIIQSRNFTCKHTNVEKLF